MNELELDYVKKRNFFKKENNFEKKKYISSNLIWGKHLEEDFLVSIVIPAYNRPDTLKEAISSALNQNGNYKYQIIISDDTRDSQMREQILSFIKSVNDEKIVYYYNEEQLGLYGNWNRCIELANSDWVIMLHTDERLAMDYLEQVMPIVQEHSIIDLIAVEPQGYDCYGIIRDAGEKKDKKCFPLYYQLNDFGGMFPLQCAMFKRDTFLEYGGFVCDGSVIEDLTFKMVFSYYYKVYVLDSPLYFKNGLGQSTDVNIWEDQLIYQYYILKNACEKRCLLIRPLLRAYLKYNIIKTANEFNMGKNFFEKKCNVNIKTIKSACDIKSDNWTDKQIRNMENVICKIKKVHCRRANKNALF